MQFFNYRRNRVGGIDADKRLSSGEVAPYTLSDDEVKVVPKDAFIADYVAPTKDEKALMNEAFQFKGVVCSVRESDQNGWEVVGSRLKTLLERGEPFRPIPFFMENGNFVLLETHDEWLNFVDAGWLAREKILMERIK